MGHHPRTITTDLEQTVISNGLCIGCGTCAAIKDSPFSMALNEYGQYEAYAVTQNDRTQPQPSASASKVCPFSANVPDEDTIGLGLFSDACGQKVDGLGYFRSLYGGHVTQEGFRERGSSGGFGSWILNELLETGAVDYVIHVRPAAPEQSENLLFSYQLSGSPQEIALGGKSRYYPVELSEALKEVRKTPGRYAIIGLPCFIKSIRLLQQNDPVMKERIRFCIGLVCGHLKSSGYAESLAWQAGIASDRLKRIDFRVKDNTDRADRYCTLAASDTEVRIIPTKELLGTDWGAGTFKYKACDFCDDVFAETADLVLGDAWLPQYVHDPLGTNLLVVRNKHLEGLLLSAAEDDRIEINSLSVEETLLSQDAGLRHRREGLSYRLRLEQEAGHWTPPKRISALSKRLPKHERQRQLLRIRMREISHTSFLKAKTAGDLSIYLDSFGTVYREYKRIRPGLIAKLLAKLKKLKQKLLGRP